MKLRRWLRRIVVSLAALAGLLALIVGAGWLYLHPDATRTDGFVYGKRGDRDLTIDVVKPARPNGLGVALLVSGGWKSSTNSFRTWMVAPLLRRGYTVLAVYHVSQPESSVMEIVDDMHRAIRFIRHRATEFGIDPNRLGVTGGSAGGHLSLMLATRGGPGLVPAAEAGSGQQPGQTPQPWDAASSAVQAVAIFYPVTDLLRLDGSTEDLGDGGPPKSFRRAFGPNATNPAVWQVIGRDTSPIYHVTTQLPPTLIVHGDADTLVPLRQSQRFQARAREEGRTVELVVHPGGGHGWLTMLWDVRRFADWFDRHLKPPTA